MVVEAAAWGFDPCQNGFSVLASPMRFGTMPFGKIKSSSPNKYLVHSTTQCVESGEIGSGQTPLLFTSKTEAHGAYLSAIEGSRWQIEREIRVLNAPVNKLSFSAPYFFHAAVFQVPPDMQSTEAAVSWIEVYLQRGGDASQIILHHAGATFDPDGERPASLEDYLFLW